MQATTSYLVMARDPALSPEDVRHALDRILDFMPGAQFRKSQPDNGITVLDIPDDKAPDVRKLLGEKFVVEPNSSLRY